jgi:predicted DNA repair protein MutK
VKDGAARDCCGRSKCRRLMGRWTGVRMRKTLDKESDVDCLAKILVGSQALFARIVLVAMAVYFLYIVFELVHHTHGLVHMRIT